MVEVTPEWKKMPVSTPQDRSSRSSDSLPGLPLKPRHSPREKDVNKTKGRLGAPVQLPAPRPETGIYDPEKPLVLYPGREGVCAGGEGCRCIFLVIKPSVSANKLEQTVLPTDFFLLLCIVKKNGVKFEIGTRRATEF